MNSLAFFVQNNHVERVTVPVATYAHSRGIALEDRSSGQGFNPDDCGIDWTQYDVVLPYGSVQFLRRLKKSSLARFVLHDEVAFATSTWAPLFGDDALNGGGRVVSAAEVASLLERGAQHLRPDRVDKAFTGGVFDCDAWKQQQAERALEDTLVCWASPLQDIQAEWRCWVVGGSIVEISQYRKAGQMARHVETSSEVWTVAQSFANRYVPAPCVVMDIAMTPTGYKLIEFNPLHGSGWYAARVDTVLDAWVLWACAEASLRAQGRPAPMADGLCV